MPEEIAQLKRELRELKAEFDLLKSNDTIPFEIDNAFRDRLSALTDLVVSAKGADTEDQAVNEGGSSTYDVLGDPDGFLQIDIAGSNYHNN